MAMSLDFMTKTKQLGSWVSDKGKKTESLQLSTQALGSNPSGQVDMGPNEIIKLMSH